jgi:enamine deaminase RidA (YjgF/YER057c/UK114 family)
VIRFLLDMGIAQSTGQYLISKGYEGAGRHLHCSGQVAVRPNPASELGIAVISPDAIRGQMEAALANVNAVLEKAEMTRANVTSLRFFTTDIDGFLENYDVYAGSTVPWLSSTSEASSSWSCSGSSWYRSSTRSWGS